MCHGETVDAKDIPPPFNPSRIEESKLESFISFDTLKEAREVLEKSFIASKLSLFNILTQ